MVRRCCVATCRNGGADCDEKVWFFEVPNEQSLFEKWARAIGQTATPLSKTSSICERHFREDEIERETVLRDSLGNIIFQKPLNNLSLVKEAIPSIFDENLKEQTVGKKRRKRRMTISDHPDFLNTENFIISNEGNLNINYSNILVSLHENENNIVQFNVTSDNSTSDLILTNHDQRVGEYNYKINMENINDSLDTNYYINGYANTFMNSINGYHSKSYEGTCENMMKITDDTKSVISIYIKPHHEEDKNNLNNIEKINRNETFNSLGTSFFNKQQVSQKITNQYNNFTGHNLEIPKEAAIIIPDNEIIILNASNVYTHNNNNNNNNNNNINNNNTQMNVQTKSDIIHHPLPETNIQMNIHSFNLIFHNSNKIKLPNSMWGYHKNNVDKNIIIFSKTKWFKSDVLIPPLYEKQVIFHENDEIKIYINNKFSPLEVRRPKDISEMELILQSVDEISVCSGGPNIGECDTAHCAQKDYAVNKWRHKLCPIILTSEEFICKFCSTINKVMRYPKKKKFAFGRRIAT